MKSAPIRYGVRLGCRWGMPHDPIVLHETPQCKIERCKLCGIRKRFNKGFGGRIDNVEYLRFHVRSFAQKNGSTKRVWAKMHKPDSLKIRL